MPIIYDFPNPVFRTLLNQTCKAPIEKEALLCAKTISKVGRLLAAFYIV